jgi:hypothetical protein
MNMPLDDQLKIYYIAMGKDHRLNLLHSLIVWFVGDSSRWWCNLYDFSLFDCHVRCLRLIPKTKVHCISALLSVYVLFRNVLVVVQEHKSCKTTLKPAMRFPARTYWQQSRSSWTFKAACINALIAPLQRSVNEPFLSTSLQDSLLIYLAT